MFELYFDENFENCSELPQETCGLGINFNEDNEQMKIRKHYEINNKKVK